MHRYIATDIGIKKTLMCKGSSVDFPAAIRSFSFMSAESIETQTKILYSFHS